MGFVKAPEEVARLEQALSAPRFVSAQRLSMRFRTDPDVLAKLVPPPLRPAEDPVAVATVGRWHSNCVGDFAGGMLYLGVRHEDVEGAYVLAMYMDAEPPITFGRELLGEPKKLARAGLSRDGAQVSGWVERHGVRLIELAAQVGRDLGPAETQRSTFNVKARSAAGGFGLEEDAILTRTQYRTKLHVQLTGTGTMTLRSTVHDPLAEVPILTVLDAVYAEDDASASCAPVATIPAATFLPYHLGREDDWLALNTAPPASVSSTA